MNLFSGLASYGDLSKFPRLPGGRKPFPGYPDTSQLPRLAPGQPPALQFPQNAAAVGPVGMQDSWPSDVPVTGGPTGPTVPVHALPRLPRASADTQSAPQPDPLSEAGSRAVSDHDAMQRLAQPKSMLPVPPPALTPDQQAFADSIVTPGSKLPNLPTRPGLLGGTYDPNTDETSWLGGAITYKPKEGQTGSDRLQAFGASLQDAAAQLSGHPEDARHLRDYQGQDTLQRRQKALDAAMQQIEAANGDADATRRALVNAALAGADTRSITDAMSYGKPSLKAYGHEQNVYAIGPDGLPMGMVQKGTNLTSRIAGGMVQDPSSGQWTQIPGYVQQQQAIARAKASSRTSGPTAGAMQLPGNPASMFRSR